MPPTAVMLSSCPASFFTRTNLRVLTSPLRSLEKRLSLDALQGHKSRVLSTYTLFMLSLFGFWHVCAQSVPKAVSGRNKRSKEGHEHKGPTVGNADAQLQQTYHQLPSPNWHWPFRVTHSQGAGPQGPPRQGLHTVTSIRIIVSLVRAYACGPHTKCQGQQVWGCRTCIPNYFPGTHSDGQKLTLTGGKSIIPCP